MLIEKSIEQGDELPYRIEINGFCCAAKCPCAAVIGALGIGKIIPPGMTNPGEVAKHIFQERVSGNYHDSSDWREVIRILNEDTF